jgi:N6-adenosine-specific RNA methylase IME4
MTDLSAHPAAAIFPMLPEDELQQLADNIAANGLLYPIILFDGLVLDGRNRLAACTLASVVPTFDHWTGEDPIGYVISCNVERRNINATQLAFCALASMPLYVEQARDRQEWAKAGGNPPLTQLVEEGSGEAASHAAKQFHTNRQYIYDAKRIDAERPDLAEQCKAGKLTISQAMREIKRGDRVALIADDLPTGNLYPVLYADPPWRYDFAPSSSREIENQYPTLSTKEIGALDVPALATPDAVLFLWATSPKLPQAFEVLEAWGFEYRTCMIWVKPQLGMGYYARQQHELLLIASRGSLPVPEPQNRPRSVIESSRLKHSEKPAEFRQVIETMYPEYPRLELFARTAAPGWDRWGNQS